MKRWLMILLKSINIFGTFVCEIDIQRRVWINYFIYTNLIYYMHINLIYYMHTNLICRYMLRRKTAASTFQLISLCGFPILHFSYE